MSRILYMRLLTVSFLLVALLFQACTQAQAPEKGVITSAQADFEVEVLLEDLSIAWGLALLPDGSFLVTERGGTLIHFNPKTQAKVSIAGIPEDLFVHGQGGLMEVVLHPNYEENGWIYFTYAYSPDGKMGNTCLMRAKISNNTLVNKEILFKGTPLRKAGQHFGGRIVFNNEGYLFLSIGDRGARENAQNPSNVLGTVMRFHDDGRIPADNPFVGKSGYRAEIYSYGHRNPQGLALHPQTGQVWEHEHGPRGGDEINLIKAGINYGWPSITYGKNYSGTIITKDTAKAGMEQPLRYYVPSIAPCGMDFYDGDLFPNWKGDLFVGSLKFMYVERLELEGNKVVASEKLLEKYGRVRSIRQGKDGYLYVVTGAPGRVMRLKPAN